MVQSQISICFNAYKTTSVPCFLALGGFGWYKVIFLTVFTAAPLILLRFSGVFSISVAHLSRSNTSKQHFRRFLLHLFSFLSVSVAQYLPLLFRSRLLSPDNATYLRVSLNFRSNFPVPLFCQHPFFCFRATEFPKGNCLRSNLSCKGQFRALSSADCATPFQTFLLYRSISAEAFLFAPQ